MLTCKQASQIISQSLDRNLSWQERLTLRLHLFICKYCKRFSQQLFTLRVALKRMNENVENDSDIVLVPEAKIRLAKLIETNVN